MSITTQRATHAIGVARMLVRSPRQVRHVPRLASLIGQGTLEAQVPWLAFDVIDWLEANLDATSAVLEYGGGGSTAFFSQRVARVVTIEHDHEWAAALRRDLGDSPSVTIIESDSANDFADYVAEVDLYPLNAFDLVLIDGRKRVECLTRSVDHVKPGGYIMLDDSDRARYAAAFDVLAGWDYLSFRGISPSKRVFGYTTVWCRPFAS